MSVDGCGSSYRDNSTTIEAAVGYEYSDSRLAAKCLEGSRLDLAGIRAAQATDNQCNPVDNVSSALETQVEVNSCQKVSRWMMETLDDALETLSIAVPQDW